MQGLKPFSSVFRKWCICIGGCVLILMLGVGAMAASSPYSKSRNVPSYGPLDYSIAATSATTVFDVVISLYNDPSGDDDPDNDTGSEEQSDYEAIIRLWADAIYEQTNGSHNLGKVRIFRNGKQGARADVVWNASEWPRANISGFGVDGKRIMFGDIFPEGRGQGQDYDMLANPKGAGYTLGHEWGHYVYGLYDEYEGKSYITWFTSPRKGDSPVIPAIMNRQWNAVNGDMDWLNHSTSDNYSADTAQGRTYEASCWEVLVRETTDDPKGLLRLLLPERTHYTSLVGFEPTAADGWIKTELPAQQDQARANLKIIWMQEDIEMNVVIDRSGSMIGTKISNAKQAASALVDVVEDGHTALGVMTFASSYNQLQAITAIPDPGDTVKSTIKAAIDGISAGGTTYMFSAASQALTNLKAYQSNNGTNANQVVFVLSDGDTYDTSMETSVTEEYLAADVPVVTFGYGSGLTASGIQTLQRFASNTNGLFFFSPTSLSDIQSAFLAANTAVSDSVSIAGETSAVPSDGTIQTFDFEVDSTLSSFTIVVSYTGNVSDLTMALKGPSGSDVETTFSATAESGATSAVATIDEMTVSTEGNGTWTLEMISTTGLDIESTVNIIAIPSTGRTYDVTVSSIDGGRVSYPNPIVLTATVSQGTPITGVNMTAIMEAPSGAETSINMNDEGEGGDADAGDGVYSAVVGYPEGNGIYSFRVSIDNTAGQATTTTTSFQPTHFFSPDLNGDMPEAPAATSITEKFVRNATLQVTVDSVQSDDHSDTLPGTEIQADNTSTPGMIDFAGDVDLFEIKQIDTSADLVVRVFNIGLDMEPEISVYMSDGSTLVTSADLTTTAASKTGYLFVVVGNADIDPTGEMVVSVNHLDGTAAAGSYEISAGPALSSDHSAASPPSVTTGAASDIGSGSATISAAINPNGSTTNYYFEYGTDTNYGSTTDTTDAGSGNSDVNVTASLSGLSDSTTYHFRVVATNEAGSVTGTDETFTTASDDDDDDGGGGGGGCFVTTLQGR
ncbi:von Willebrand factor type A, DUF1973 protein [Desulfosarcina variabilis str. Montpellier]|uniref:VWA domain-containing protein n=1 Tax=Desulfosarcina variabilis TaxID=2300 RepID=UPI003AFB6448